MTKKVSGLLPLVFGETKALGLINSQVFYEKIAPRLNTTLKNIPKSTLFSASELTAAAGYTVPPTYKGVLTNLMKEAIGNAPNVREAYDSNGKIVFHLERKLLASFDIRKTLLETRKASLKGVPDEVV